MSADLFKQAQAAWRENKLQEAYELALKGYTENPKPENACYVAAILHAAGETEAARSALRQLIVKRPSFIAAQAQLARMIKMDARAASDDAKEEITARHKVLAAMREVLEHDSFFKPGIFWSAIATKHERMLDDFGIDNFKRSVGHAYQNWLIADAKDAQWVRLREIWRKDPTDQPLLNTVEGVDDAGFYWDAEFPFYRLSNPTTLAVYTLATGILWEFARAHDALGFLRDFSESTIGNPIRIRRDGQLISQDAAHSARELNALFNTIGLSANDGLTIAELGAGHGRLAEMIGQKTNFRYLIFDIPPTLYVAQWYIQKLFPDEKIFTFRDFSAWDEVADEVNASRFAFFTPNQIKLLPKKSVDVFINISSLMEMKKSQISYFLERISDVTRLAFFSKQWLEWTNTFDQITLTKADYELGPDFQLAADGVDEIHEGLFVQIWTAKQAAT